MATLDIRAEETPIDTIVFAEGCKVKLNSPYFRIVDKEGDIVEFHQSDLDNLIKALQKAKELW